MVGMSRKVATVLHVDDEPNVVGEYVHTVRTKDGDLKMVGCDLELVPTPETNLASNAESDPRPERQNDRTFERLAIEEARKSVPEDDRVHPSVGVVVVKDGEVLALAHRGEIPKCHAEYIALEKKLADVPLSGATVYTTLEPCTSRTDPKVPCADRLAERRVGRVVIGMLDPDNRVSGRGLRVLRKAGVTTDLFPPDLMAEVEELNRHFMRDRESRDKNGLALGQEIVPPDWAVSALIESEFTPKPEAVRRKLATTRLNALHPGLTVWITNRSDARVFVKSASLWHGHKRLNHGVLSDNRTLVEVRPRTENTGIAFVTDEDAMLKLQNLGIVDRRLPTYTSLNVDLEVRVEYDLSGVEDEYRDVVSVRVYGTRQIVSL